MTSWRTSEAFFWAPSWFAGCLRAKAATDTGFVPAELVASATGGCTQAGKLRLLLIEIQLLGVDRTQGEVPTILTLCFFGFILIGLQI